MAEYSLNAWGMKPTKHGDSFRIWWKQNNSSNQDASMMNIAGLRPSAIGVDQDFETEVGLMNCLMNHVLLQNVANEPFDLV